MATPKPLDFKPLPLLSLAEGGLGVWGRHTLSSAFGEVGPVYDINTDEQPFIISFGWAMVSKPLKILLEKFFAKSDYSKRAQFPALALPYGKAYAEFWETKGDDYGLLFEFMKASKPFPVLDTMETIMEKAEGSCLAYGVNLSSGDDSDIPARIGIWIEDDSIRVDITLNANFVTSAFNVENPKDAKLNVATLTRLVGKQFAVLHDNLSR